MVVFRIFLLSAHTFHTESNISIRLQYLYLPGRSLGPLEEKKKAPSGCRFELFNFLTRAGLIINTPFLICFIFSWLAVVVVVICSPNIIGDPQKYIISLFNRKRITRHI